MNLLMLKPTDSKSPKVKKRIKKEDHDYTDDKKVSMCFCFFYHYSNLFNSVLFSFLGGQKPLC